MFTFLRLSMKISDEDPNILRLGEFSYTYRKKDQDACLMPYDLSFVLHVPYFHPDVYFKLIDELTKCTGVTYTDENFVIDNKSLLKSCTQLVLDYVPISCSNVDIYQGVITMATLGYSRELFNTTIDNYVPVNHRCIIQ